jgi:glycosyltransferase involved in cell wall biosynthesis
MNRSLPRITSGQYVGCTSATRVPVPMRSATSSDTAAGIITGRVSPTSQIAVIVPSHRSERTIGACLDGLRRQTLATNKFEVHVVDTNVDATAKRVADGSSSWDGTLRYHAVEGGGPAEHRNYGVACTDAPYLAFTDADCVPDPDWLAAGLERLRKGASIVQGPTLTPDGRPPPPFSHAISIEGPTSLFETCNVMYERRAFERAGGFPEDAFELTASPFGEDAILAWAVRDAGGAVAFEERAIVRHLVLPPDYRSHLRYQWQTLFFPYLVKRVPGLRTELLTARLFLGPRSLRFCAAAVALLTGRRTRLAWVLALPYASRLGGVARRARTPSAAARGVGKHLIADIVREAALVWGSVRFRSPVL